ncbi:uncharacterized protein LAESUDRAFT_317344 [Laetiporus sulphureus 93-53]|uniref:Uncharacterized protein n=1 Tax=Laetiporus sulphureus 93-53 TaxID=1314785 RepID=A0A165D0L1_9APHY|nr:uncharacterized protein LAESUDRAFT_317344 [Laetiporus sulphureus 93-53]KZT03894.1 hypothetical protein LAESUDRAFT_317344 [Laetiporus sulphureus 93-53]
MALKVELVPSNVRQRTDLLQHLRAEHFSNILRVPRRDWDLYMRTCEGKSGATDSMAVPSRFTSSSVGDAQSQTQMGERVECAASSSLRSSPVREPVLTDNSPSRVCSTSRNASSSPFRPSTRPSHIYGLMSPHSDGRENVIQCLTSSQESPSTIV